jgi:retinol dehydrogenase 12
VNNVFFVRSMANRLSATHPSIVINVVSPGFCESELRRDISQEQLSSLQFAAFDEHRYTAEEGSREILYAALAEVGNEDALKGKFISHSKVSDVSDFMNGGIGIKMQDAIWVCAVPYIWMALPAEGLHYFRMICCAF